MGMGFGAEPHRVPRQFSRYCSALEALSISTREFLSGILARRDPTGDTAYRQLRSCVRAYPPRPVDSPTAEARAPTSRALATFRVQGSEGRLTSTDGCMGCSA